MTIFADDDELSHSSIGRDLDTSGRILRNVAATAIRRAPRERAEHRALDRDIEFAEIILHDCKRRLMIRLEFEGVCRIKEDADAA
jgi:hypothetical protein